MCLCLLLIKYEVTDDHVLFTAVNIFTHYYKNIIQMFGIHATLWDVRFFFMASDVKLLRQANIEEPKGASLC